MRSVIIVCLFAAALCNVSNIYAMSEEEFVRNYLMPVDEEEEFYQIGYDLSKVAAESEFDGRVEF